MITQTISLQPKIKTQKLKSRYLSGQRDFKQTATIAEVKTPTLNLELM
jgi:hypothetical protein